jgi:hypothetical protein
LGSRATPQASRMLRLIAFAARRTARGCGATRHQKSRPRSRPEAGQDAPPRRNPNPPPPRPAPPRRRFTAIRHCRLPPLREHHWRPPPRRRRPLRRPPLSRSPRRRALPPRPRYRLPALCGLPPATSRPRHAPAPGSRRRPAAPSARMTRDSSPVGRNPRRRRHPASTGVPPGARPCPRLPGRPCPRRPRLPGRLCPPRPRLPGLRCPAPLPRRPGLRCRPSPPGARRPRPAPRHPRVRRHPAGPWALPAPRVPVRPDLRHRRHAVLDKVREPRRRARRPRPAARRSRRPASRSRRLPGPIALPCPRRASPFRLPPVLVVEAPPRTRPDRARAPVVPARARRAPVSGAAVPAAVPADSVVAPRAADSAAPVAVPLVQAAQVAEAEPVASHGLPEPRVPVVGRVPAAAVPRLAAVVAARPSAARSAGGAATSKSWKRKS